MSQPSERMVLLARVCVQRWNLTTDAERELLNIINREYEKGYNRACDDVSQVMRVISVTMSARNPALSEAFEACTEELEELRYT